LHQDSERPFVTLIDLTQLCEPYRRLRLERERGHWIVVGSDGDTVYVRTPDVLTAVRFMRAFARQHGAELDEGSITEGLLVAEEVAWRTAQQVSTPMVPGGPSMAELFPTLAYNRLVDALRGDPFSRRVADVIPIRKEQA
jgi:hypothetical protein